jgi:hypothetical protein
LRRDDTIGLLTTLCSAFSSVNALRVKRAG